MTTVTDTDQTPETFAPFEPFLAGARAVAPLMLGVIPFGIVAGVGAAGVGLPALQAFAPSFVIFAGAAQLAMMDLLGRGAPALVITLTALIINLRMAMYSASLAPHFRGLPLGWKAALSYFLTDQAYAVSIIRYQRPMALGEKAFYYAGAGMSLWAVWQASTLAGVTVGARVPPGWSLDFAVPLMFLALLIPAVKDRASGAAALCAGLAAVLLAGLPYNIGMVAASLIGIIVGSLWGWRKK
ncbi:MAG: AzlC family ABC transporter permease [Proteobacteria bacterium]|nr:AzlC family ABC transporter permease [Pseudomonadota bacterium]